MPCFNQTEVGRIRTLLLKHARDAFCSQEEINRQWRRLHYTEAPAFAAALKEYERFQALLEGFGVELHFLPRDPRASLDSIYVRDGAVVCEKGIVLCSMGKEARRGEPEAQAVFYGSTGLPILGRIEGTGCLEGGDVLWLDERTLAVARSYRTNDEGIRQLGDLLGDCIDALVRVPLPHYRGPKDVFHLMSIISPIDKDLALVFSPLMPIPFREELISRGVELVEVPEEEFETMGCNVLTVAPRKCVMIASNDVTRRRLEKLGVEVHTFEGKEICAKGAGGATCLTRPLERGAV